MISAARNITGAFAAMRGAVAACGDAPVVTLSELCARARLATGGLRDFTDDELRELLELGLMPGAFVPAGRVGESALAYLLAVRRKQAPVPTAIARLKALGGNGQDAGALGDWLDALYARRHAAADALGEYAARRAVQ